MEENGGSKKHKHVLDPVLGVSYSKCTPVSHQDAIALVGSDNGACFTLPFVRGKKVLNPFWQT